MFLAQVVTGCHDFGAGPHESGTGDHDFGAGAEKWQRPAPQQKHKRLITNHLPQDTGAGPQQKTAPAPKNIKK